MLVLLVAGWYAFIRPEATLPEAPDVVGLPLAEAKAAAVEARLAFRQGTPALASNVASGTVLSQKPEAGARPEDGRLTVVAARGPLPVKITKLDDLDPEGDGTEQPDLLPNLTDGAASTAWQTELYRRADFGGLKQAVGIGFTLQEAAAIVRVEAAAEGWHGELRARASDGTVKVLAQLEGKKSQTVSLGEPIRDGQIWITQLAPAGREGRFDVGLTELAFAR